MNWQQLSVPKEFLPTDPRFGSGPSVINMESLQQLAKLSPHLIGTSHRKNQVLDLVKEVQTGFRTYFKLPADYRVVLGNGGATFLWDMIGLGLCEKASFHYTCGEFSQKWHAAHKKIPWISAKNKSANFGEGLQAEYVDGHDLICTTLNETSTGVQNTYLPSVPDNALVLVDATSGAGQIAMDLSKSDFYYFSPQKVFGGDGGLFFGFMSPKAVQRAEKIAKDQSRYIPEIMNWNLCLDNSQKHQTYNTPSILNLVLVNEQLKQMNKIGSAAVEQEAKRKAKLLYTWAEEKKYLTPYVTNPNHRSQAVATIDVDSSVDVTPMLQFLRDKKWVYDIDGYRKLERNQVRISMFHNISYDNLERLTKLLSFLIENAKS